MPNINLICTECSKPFYHSEKDQEFYAERKFTNLPKRCFECRQERRRNSVPGPDPQRGGK